MAITIDWGTKTILVPRTYGTLIQSVPIEVRELDIDTFRKDLNALQASEEGAWADTTHAHYPPVVVAGVALAMVISIINDYTVTFENGSYAVNITGGNSNIADVVNINNVSVRSSNSAGLVDARDILAESEKARKLLSNRQELYDNGTNIILRTYEDDGVTVLEENIVTKSDDSKPDISTGVTKRLDPT